MLDISALIIALAAAHGYHDEDRLRDVAENITQVAQSTPVFCGEAQVQATQALLVAIGDHESGWNPKVQDGTLCDGRSAYCDSGRAHSLWQLHSNAWLGHSAAEVDSDNLLATELAARVLRRFRGRGTVQELLTGYATGSTIRSCKAAEDMAAHFDRLVRPERIVVSFRNGCLTASRKP